MAILVNRLPRVAILLENPHSTHTQLLRGVLRYIQRHRPWTLDIRLGRKGEPPLPDVLASPPDGVLARNLPPSLERLARRRRLPLILINDIFPELRPTARIVCDNDAIARLAVEHLVGRGFERFAFVGERSGEEWSVGRADAFVRELAARGFPCDVYPGAAPEDGETGSGDDHAALRRWLLTLPKPVAVFAAYDIRAREVLDACAEAGVPVPADVAVLGVDDDDVLCETAVPALSSIALSTEAAGYLAAEALDEAMSGRRRAAGTLRIAYAGLGVVERRSTAHDAARDELVRRCRALIESSVSGRFGVADLVKSLHVSRRMLETRFRAATGRTLHGEITEQRIRRAKNLLAQTPMTQAQVAAACGFSDASHMNAVFHRVCGAAPSAFRAVAVRG